MKKKNSAIFFTFLRIDKLPLSTLLNVAIFQTFDCVIKIRTEWYTNRTRQGHWVNGWVTNFVKVTNYSNSFWRRWQEYKPHHEKYDDNNDLSVMMFDINHGYRRKEDAIRLEMVHISKQESRRNNEHGLNTRYRLHTHTQCFSNLVWKFVKFFLHQNSISKFNLYTLYSIYSIFIIILCICLGWIQRKKTL